MFLNSVVGTAFDLERNVSSIRATNRIPSSDVIGLDGLDMRVDPIHPIAWHGRKVASPMRNISFYDKKVVSGVSTNLFGVVRTKRCGTTSYWIDWICWIGIWGPKHPIQ